ncbi:metal-dependent hydrolase [Natribacillus halophilus]|uniref:Inner membrane protein n=1 Tax=Natribacillus halophilus TaxID=549003 RepID=A0A1G8R4Q3_9BACI|nr:metal-dependent hydrolase [Natribacillus halophilus]SDJ11961.1 inner membrane protein [Natribacillus halophilus]
MDTASHVAMGVGITGLATLDPGAAASTATMQAVALGAIIGSQAPDFDTVLKMKNNATYITNHRGATHSIPAVILWSVLVTAVIYLFLPEASLFHLWLWTFLAIVVHVLVDIFNAYGTKALAPIKDRWIAIGAINTFDPFIFMLHIVGVVFWIAGAHPGYTFLIIYSIIALYYVWRMKARNRVIRHARRLHPYATHIFVSPTYQWSEFHLVIRTLDYLHVATWKKNNIRYLESYPFEPIPDDPIIQAARDDHNLAAFLSFSPTYRWEVHQRPFGGYDVVFTDLRYRAAGYYPFVSVVRLDRDLCIEGSYTGWIYDKEKLEYKLKISRDSKKRKRARLLNAT